MTIEIENLLQSFEEWTSFTRSLQILEVEVWDSSIEVGKWSIKEIITHITLWDKYFYEEAIAKIATNQPLSLAHLDYDEFNSKAITYSRTITTDELIEKAGIYRNQIIGAIRTMSIEALDENYIDLDGHIFHVPQYLKDFIWHDQHHLVPLKEYLLTIQST